MTDPATLLANDFWVRANSRWRYWTWTLFATWVAFMLIGMRARHPRWIALGFAYSIPFIGFCIADAAGGENSEDTAAYTVSMIVMLVFWPVSIFHAQHLLPRYLQIRAEVETAPGRGRAPMPPPAGHAGPPGAPPPQVHDHPLVSDAQHASAGYFDGPGPNPGPAPGGMGGTPLSRWRSPEHPETPEVRHGAPVDLNRAGAAELADLPGIGIVLAKRAIDIRDRAGEFDSIDAFGAALELKPHVLERLRPHVVATISMPVERSAGRVIDF